MEYVPSDVFGEDYLYFYEELLDEELSDAQAELLWETLQLEPGADVSFGYFGDEGNRAWLGRVLRTLKPGGRLAIDVHSRDVFMRNRGHAAVFERDGDLVVDRHSFDVETGREATERWTVRGGRVRKTEYSVRFYTFTELRDLLLDVGFTAVRAVGHDGEPLTLESRRMVVVATR